MNAAKDTIIILLTGGILIISLSQVYFETTERHVKAYETTYPSHKTKALKVEIKEGEEVNFYCEVTQ